MMRQPGPKSDTQKPQDPYDDLSLEELRMLDRWIEPSNDLAEHKEPEYVVYGGEAGGA